MTRPRAAFAGIALLAMAAAPVHPTSKRLARLETRIEAAIRGGDLDRDGAKRLRRQCRALADRERRYRADGLSTRELNDLDKRLDGLAARLLAESADREVR